jgi:hypothetical protein
LARARIDEGQKATEVFQSLVQIHVGDERKVRFWKDRWINGKTAEEVAPEVTALVSTRKKNCRLLAQALPGKNWIKDVVGEMTVEGCIQCIRLWEEIEMVPRSEDEPDRFTWKGTASVAYSTKETYKMLCQGSTVFAMFKPLWRSFAPRKCKIF